MGPTNSSSVRCQGCWRCGAICSVPVWSKGCCCLVDWDWSGQREIRRACHLPVLHRLWVHRSGYALGYMKPRWQDPAQLFFLSINGDVLSIADMDSSLTDVVKGENRWSLRIYPYA
jgi:hypothetical protein